MLHAAPVPGCYWGKTQQCPLLHWLCRYVWSLCLWNKHPTYPPTHPPKQTHAHHMNFIPSRPICFWSRLALLFCFRRGTHLLRPTHHTACGGAVRRRPGPRWDVPLSAPTLSYAHLWTGPIHRSGRNGRGGFYSTELLCLRLKSIVNRNCEQAENFMVRCSIANCFFWFLPGLLLQNRGRVWWLVYAHKKGTSVSVWNTALLLFPLTRPNEVTKPCSPLAVLQKRRPAHVWTGRQSALSLGQRGCP